MNTIATAALAAALISSAGAPAQAGEVCSELDLGSPCVSSSDLKASYVLGGSSGDGRLRIRDDAKVTGVDLRARNGNVTNRFSNDEDESNGLIKAWAKINPDGSVAACWRCNRDPAETQRLNTGSYEVDFTPLDTDITGRPRSVAISGNGAVAPALALAVDRTMPPDDSTVHVFTHDLTTGARADSPFVLIIY